MSDHYIEHMQAELRRLRQENHLLHAKVASLQAKAPNDAQVHLLLSRITELTARAEAVEAAIQRVRAARDLMEESGFDESFWYVAKIDDALRGDSDE